ncbi:hypothetical protein [Streptomyces sp. NPDC058092]|uniref:IS1096 element passenger TnpR family protein n=1 Tax=Streptomyces sp. NPDC058092 TaxID=3346336 RepID=UPI0036E3B8EF
MDGAGACPPEDCGGAPGYSDLKVILADPAHEEHHAMLVWLGLRSATDSLLPLSRRTRPTRGCCTSRHHERRAVRPRSRSRPWVLPTDPPAPPRSDKDIRADLQSPAFGSWASATRRPGALCRRRASSCRRCPR